jgi:hypothetical protein
VVDIQEANGDEQRPDDQGRNSHLRLSNAVVLSSVVSVDLVREPCTNRRSDDESGAETEIGNDRRSQYRTRKCG